MTSDLDLARKYEWLAVEKEKLADCLYQAAHSANTGYSRKLLDEAHRTLDQAQRLRSQARRLGKHAERQLDDCYIENSTRR